MKVKIMELGIYTFAGMSPDPTSGVAIDAHQRMQNLLEEMELADQVGLDVFGIGEHHRPDFVISISSSRFCMRRSTLKRRGPS